MINILKDVFVYCLRRIYYYHLLLKVEPWLAAFFVQTRFLDVMIHGTDCQIPPMRFDTKHLFIAEDPSAFLVDKVSIK